MNNPIVISVDGIDGCGKNTTVNKIEEILTVKNGMRVKKLSFPMYNNKTSVLIKDFLNGELDPNKKLDPYTKAMLFAIERRIYFTNASDELMKYDVILLDRSFISNAVYQLVEFEKEAKTRAEIEEFLDNILDLEFNYCNFNDVLFPINNNYFKFILYHENFETNLKMIINRSIKDNRPLDENEKNSSYLKACHDAQLNLLNYLSNFSDTDKYYKESYSYELIKVSDNEGCINLPNEIANNIINSVYNKLK